MRPFDLSRYRGALLGLATGDAVGSAVEFRPPGTFPPVTGMQGGGPFGLQPGEWTDDTSMALCLAESLLASGGLDPLDQLDRYVRWWRHGYWSSTGACFDIGNATRAALAAYEQSGQPNCGSTDPRTAGNGSLMRLASVPMYFAADPALAIDASGRSSLTTHGAEAAVDSCRYYGGLIVGALRGVEKEVLLGSRFSPLPEGWSGQPLMPEVDEVAAGSFLRREPPEIQGVGYVVRSLEAALWAFSRSRTFAEGCLLAVNLGNDADTTAAIYGQLAGAYYGDEAIPPEWLSVLAFREEIASLAERLRYAP